MEESTVEICDACSKGDLDLVKRLVMSGTSPWVRDDQGNTLFHLCCSSSHCGLDVLQYLIAASEIVSCSFLRNSEGSSPLHLACGAGKKEFVEHLICGHHCDFGLPTLQGETPLYFASRNGHSNIVSLICTNPDYILDPDDIYQCIKVAPNWDIMTILLRAISFRGFMTRVRQENHVYLAKQIFQSSITIQWKDSSSPPLHQVAVSGDLDIVQYLVNEVGCDVNGLDSEAYTPLHRAIEYGHLPIVQYLLSHPQCNCETRSNNCGMYPLHHAARLGYLEIVNALVAGDCDINVSDDKGYTPIHNACNYGHLAVVEYLASKPQCNLEVLDNTGWQPLHYALCQGRKEIVMFLREKVSVDSIHQCIKSAVEDNVPGSMIEMLVSKIGFKEYLKKRRQEDQPAFISKDTNVNYIFESDYPLCEAVELRCVDVAQYLVRIGTFILESKRYILDRSPLHIACNEGHFEMVQVLTSHLQCNVEAENDCKQRPLHLACQSGSIDIIRHLVVEKNCDVTAKDNFSDTPLHVACEKGHFEIVKILTAHPRCNIEVENTHHQRPLHKACESGNLDIVIHLVQEKDCEVTVKCCYGNTPLHIASEKGHSEVVKILTAHPSCNIEVENKQHKRPLHIACQSENVDIVQHLVELKKCDVTAKSQSSNTPLHIACEKGCFEIVKILTKCSQANIDTENDYHQRPLHLACYSGNVEIVQHLVEDVGCNVNDFYGDNTPLHIACEKGHFKIVKILTNRSLCNIETENFDGLRPLELACQSGNADIVRHLVQQGCSKITAKDKFGKLTSMKTSICKYQQAMLTSGEAMLCVVKCILTGPPGAGKSTLKKRLLNESLTELSLSTGVVDAAIQVNSFRKLQKQSVVVPGLIKEGSTEWRKQDLDEEAVLVLEKIATNNSQSHHATNFESKSVIANAMTYEEGNLQNIAELDPKYKMEGKEKDVEDDNEMNISEDITETFENKIEKRFVEEKEKEIEDDNEMNKTDLEKQEGTQEIDEELEKEKEKGFRKKVETTGAKHKEGINSLSKLVENIPAKKRKIYEERSQQTTKDSHAMLHIIDTGGQPEFHEMLPALITGPAINLLVFDLTIDLTSRYEITYRSSSGDSKPYQTSLTHEEVIFRSLASIACLRQNTIGWSFDKVPLNDESEPAAFLIATHRDCFPNETEAQAKVDLVNNHLKLKIQDSGELFREDLVQYSTPDQVIFPLDTRNDQKEIEELRSLLHRVISNKFHELPVPASWCAFSLKLRKSKKPIHVLDTCYKMAQDCGIKDREDFKSVLWFLHHRVGVIMYYPEVEGLGNIVITDLQLVFERITQLITSCFTFKELGSASTEKEFRDNGRFSESHVKQLSSRKGDSLTPTRLVSLLKHLHIVAGPMKMKVGHKTENYYFMPCALKPAPVEEEQRDQSICPAPLTIYFECGYTPVGMLCCLVVYLLSQTSKSELEWKLLDKIVHHRNKITFIIGKYHDRVTLISRATYLEVWVDQLTPKLSLDVLCKQIISTLHEGLKTVTQSLHYTYKSCHFFGFTCCCPECISYPPHPAIVDVNDLAAECVLTREVMHLQERRHLVWSTKVYSLFPCIHYILCNTY